MTVVRQRRGRSPEFFRRQPAAVIAGAVAVEQYQAPVAEAGFTVYMEGIGAEHVAIIQSLLVTCRLHGVNAHAYLVDVLQRVGQHPASLAIELTPREWKVRFADNPLRSDLERGGKYAAV